MANNVCILFTHFTHKGHGYYRCLTCQSSDYLDMYSLSPERHPQNLTDGAVRWTWPLNILEYKKLSMPDVSLIVRPPRHVHTFTSRKLSLILRRAESVRAFAYKNLSLSYRRHSELPGLDRCTFSCESKRGVWNTAIIVRWSQSADAFSTSGSQFVTDRISLHMAWMCMYCHL